MSAAFGLSDTMIFGETPGMIVGTSKDILTNAQTPDPKETKMTYCYVTGEQCPLMKTAEIDDEIFGRPVSECGDYDAWTLNEDETNELVFSASGYRFRAARAVQREMGWQVNLYPIRDRLTMELTRIIQRDNDKFSPAEVIAWTDANVDEDDVARRNEFEPVAIAEDMAKCYTDEQAAVQA